MKFELSDLIAYFSEQAFINKWSRSKLVDEIFQFLRTVCPDQDVLEKMPDENIHAKRLREAEFIIDSLPLEFRLKNF